MKRRITWILLGIVALVIIALGIVWMNLNGIVRRTVETQASSSLNLPTTVQGARVSIFGGSVSLDDVAIGSPQGFAAPRMFALDGASVDVTYGELRKDPVRIDEVVIDEPKLVIEHKDGKLNFQTLMQQDSKAPPEGEPLKVIINELRVNEAQVVLRPGIPGLANEIQIPIPSFALQNIGTGEGAQNGAAIKQVVMQLVTTMAAKASESDKLPPEVQLLLKGNVEQVAREMAMKYGEKALEDVRKNLPPEVGGAVGDVLDATKRGEDPGKAIEKGIQGLIGGKKDDRDRDRRDQPATQPK
jgi:hypothetical protein